MVHADAAMVLLADPMVQTGLLAISGASVTRIALRHHPTRHLVGQAAFFAALTALLLYHGIVPYEPAPDGADALQRLFVGVAKAIWWINAAWALIAFVRVFLIFERQPREGRLIQDLVVATIYVGALLSVVAYVFAVPVGTLIATSGVVAIIVGLALQSTLSDVFSGIALNIGRPYAVGDWIVLDGGIEGRVLETNWRATHLINGSNDLVVLPNSSLAKATLTNMSSPERSHGVKLTVSLLPTRAPRIVVEAMREVLISCNAILKTPAPGVQIKSLTGSAVEIELSFRVSDISKSAAAKNEVFDLIHRHTLAADLRLAPTATQPDFASVPLARVGADGANPSHRSTPLRLLDAILLFTTLTEDEKEVLAGAMVRRSFKGDETIVAQGTTATALMIVRAGTALVSRTEDGHDVEIRRLSPGDCFGERGLLTAAPETETVKAITRVIIYEIDQASLAPLLRDRPAMAEELALLLSHRAENRQSLAASGTGSDDHRSVKQLMARIRNLFEIRYSE